MAFLREIERSPFWMAVFTDENGVKTTRSTKIRRGVGSRAKALQMAMEWEDAAREARAGSLTAAAAAKSLARMVEKSSGEKMTDSTVADYCAGWLAGRKGKVADSSLARYQPAVERFVAMLGPRAKKSLRGVTPSDVERYQRQLLAAGQSASTANFAVKILRVMFAAAHVRGQIPINPARVVEMLPDDGKQKDPFSMEEVGRLLAVANEDWRGMILLGALAGLRLADAAELGWDAVDIEAGRLRFLPMKTARRRRGVLMEIALHPDILAWMAARPLPHKGPVFPGLKGTATGAYGGLSNAFRRIMEAAGVGKDATRASRKGGRAFNPLSFHSLRHSFVSEMLNRSVPPDVRKMMAGHTCDRAHSRYTHLSLETQRRAVELHPGFR